MKPIDNCALPDSDARAAAPMRLSDAAIGQALRVLRVQRAAAPGADDAGDWPQQLADLGFTPGERTVLMRRGWPGNDPLAVRVGSSTFALRRAEAACVLVEPMQ